MRATGPDTQRQRQRRRRYVAAAVCLGTLAAASVGTFFVEQQRAARSGGGAAASAAGAGGAVPSPQPVGGQSASSQPVAYPLSSPEALGEPLRAALRPSGSGTAGPATVGATPGTPGAAAPSVVQAAGGAGAADNAPMLGASIAPASPSPSMTVSNPLAGSAFAGLPQVGALFAYSDGATSSHFCTGSVVSSQTGDIVMTAAHCVYDSSSGTYLSGIAFVPGYHDGKQPYGVWTPSKILVPQQWINSNDPDYDVAFLVVHQPGSDERIQDQVGADELGLNADYDSLVQVVGYPDATEQPITCTNYTKQFSPTQLEFDCPGYPDGTSGGPFLAGVSQQTGQGTIVGVIGGYQTGGDTPDVSYSVYFGSAVADLFEQAQAAG